MHFRVESMEWMSHRKWRDTKQQPGTGGPGNILGCCLVSLRFLCDLHTIHNVEIALTLLLRPDFLRLFFRLLLDLEDFGGGGRRFRLKI